MDTVVKFRFKYVSDKVNYSGSKWTEIETTLVEICLEIDEKLIAKGEVKVAETLKEQQKKRTRRLVSTFCLSNPHQFPRKFQLALFQYQSICLSKFEFS